MQPQVTPRGVAPRRERRQQIVPDGPPWKLVSPNGVLHIILDLLAVSLFCKEEGLSTFDIKHLLEIEEGNTERPMRYAREVLAAATSASVPPPQGRV